MSLLDASVIIPTRNRALPLSTTLDLFERLDTTSLAWELLVVDNGSTDHTTAVVSERSGRLPIRLLQQPTPGKNRALNQAIPEARGELIVMTDDDVVPVVGWLRDLVAAARRNPDYEVFAGPVVPRLPPTCPAWLRDHPFTAIAYARFTPNVPEGPLGDMSPHGPNYAVRKHRLQQVRYKENIGASGPNDRSYPLGDETEVLRRLRQNGKPAYYVPSAIVEHRIEPGQLELRWLLNRAFRAGRGHVCIAPDFDSPRLFGAPRYLWRRLVTEAARYYLAIDRRFPSRFNAGLQLEFVRGMLHQYRYASPARSSPGC